jgi:hypothetical protein
MIDLYFVNHNHFDIFVLVDDFNIIHQYYFDHLLDFMIFYYQMATSCP